MLYGRRVILRPIEATDQPQIVAWRNQPYVLAGLFSYRPTSLAEQERWFASYLGREDEILFIIELKQDRTAIGTVGLTKIDFRNRKAELGRLLIGNRDYLGQGYATEAVLLLLGYAFDELNLHRVYLEVIADNEPAIRVYTRCHFSVEGRCRDAHFSGGRFHDVLIMAILEEEYRAIIKTSNYTGEVESNGPKSVISK